MEIDELIKQVKLKAELLEQQQPQEFQAKVLNTVVAPDEDWVEEDEIAKSYHCDDFLIYDNQQFLELAYSVVLKRAPDDTGLASSMAFLEKGGSKQAVLADMLLSDEGQQHQVHINGMAWPLFRTRLVKKLGYIGRMLKPLFILPDHIFKPRISPTIRKLIDLEAQNKQNHQNLSKQLQRTRQSARKQFDTLSQKSESLKHQYETSLQQNERLIQQLVEQNRYLENSLAEVRMQFNYQQRNHDAFLQEIINQADRTDGEVEHREVNAILEQHIDDKLDAYYVAFEDACRGTREEIRENLSTYLPYVKETIAQLSFKENEPAIVTDLGCGRGEWLELVAEQGWQAKGLDLNKVMVQDCQAKNLEVVEGDVIEYLIQQERNSLSAITAFHIIEHLPFSSLLALYEEAIRTLKPGGMIIFETPNPENVLVGSHTFYHDPTHRNPITPTSAQFLARYTGFCRIDILRLHPYPEAARVPGNEPVTERVNGHLCGPQDYALIAYKPS